MATLRSTLKTSSILGWLLDRGRGRPRSYKHTIDSEASRYSGANIITGPGVNNWDVAVEKNTRLREDLRLQFRAEFFNAWNHAQFKNPTGLTGDANFGQVTQSREAREIQLGMKVLW